MSDDDKPRTEPAAAIGPDLRDQLAELVREQCEAVVVHHLGQAIDAVAEAVAKLMNRVAEIERSLVLVVEGQARIEAALQSFRADDADEPWRQSLSEDVSFDDEDVILDPDD